jgi:hypothetical protein
LLIFAPESRYDRGHVPRKTAIYDGCLQTWVEGAFQVFTQQAVDVVDQAHLSFWKPNCNDYRGFVLT